MFFGVVATNAIVYVVFKMERIVGWRWIGGGGTMIKIALSKVQRTKSVMLMSFFELFNELYMFG